VVPGSAEGMLSLSLKKVKCYKLMFLFIALWAE